MDIVVSNKASRPLYEQISTQIKAAIMSGELKTGEAIPSVGVRNEKVYQMWM